VELLALGIRHLLRHRREITAAQGKMQQAQVAAVAAVHQQQGQTLPGPLGLLGATVLHPQ